MFSRIALLLVTLFWLGMNYLLWRSEFGAHNQEGIPVPAAVIWRKILTAPDNSSLEIIHQGKRVGYCRLAISSGQRGKKKDNGDEMVTDGKGFTGYRLNFDGNVSLNNIRDHLHFDLSMALSTNQAWRELELRLNSRQGSLSVRSTEAEQKVHLSVGNEDEKSEQTFTFDELQNPQALLKDLGLPAPLQLMGIQGLPMPDAQKPGGLSLGLVWEARTDWIAIGHASVRAYRLRARLFDRYEVVVTVSPVGEILRVELPGEWTLVNEQLGNM